MNPGEQLENLVMSRLKAARPTKSSGAAYGDGDAVLLTDDGQVAIECKDQKRPALDKWWSQTRAQAMRFGRSPCLVVRRPPAVIRGIRSRKDEVLAVIPFEDYVRLVKKAGEA